MRIGLLTIHNSFSYGGRLQAFALATVLNRYGRVEIINYDLPHRRRARRLVRASHSWRGPLSMAKDILTMSSRAKLISAFNGFETAHLPVGPRLDAGDLKEYAAERFDVVVVGSDQVWNPQITHPAGKLDLNFFLDFVPSGVKRVAYAASSGAYRFSGNELRRIGPRLARFACVGIREEGMRSWLADTYDGSIAVVADPTLLVDREGWSRVAREGRCEVPSTPYILSYGIRRTQLFGQVVSAVRAAWRLPVVAISSWLSMPMHVDCVVRDAGPAEYVKLFENASYIVTDSFHGTVFANMFDRPFTAVSPGPNVIRISHLLSILGLENRLVENSAGAANCVGEVDFCEADIRREEFARRGHAFLSAAFGCT